MCVRAYLFVSKAEGCNPPSLAVVTCESTADVLNRYSRKQRNQAQTLAHAQTILHTSN